MTLKQWFYRLSAGFLVLLVSFILTTNISHAQLLAPPLQRPQAQEGFELGVYYDSFPYSDFHEVTDLEGVINHKIRYVLMFSAWGEDDREFPTQWVKIAHEQGRIPVITWEPWSRDFRLDESVEVQKDFSLDLIAKGVYDDYIRLWAVVASKVNGEIILRFAHEMSTPVGEINWYPWQGRPEEYIAAYRHIHKIFQQEGATNVRFMWSVTNLGQPHVWKYYPGSDVVDILGTTVLNHGTVPPWGSWRTIKELFLNQYLMVHLIGMPVMITEFASAEQGGNKGEWLREALQMFKGFPYVEAVFLLEKYDIGWTDINWSIQSSPEALEGFKEGLHGE